MQGLQVLLCEILESHSRVASQPSCTSEFPAKQHVFSPIVGSMAPPFKKAFYLEIITYDITYIWNLIYGTNEPFHRKENHGLGE